MWCLFIHSPIYSTKVKLKAFYVSDYAKCWELNEENNDILSHEINE